MNIVLVNIYPINTYAWYLLSSYVLKAYLESNNPEQKNLRVDVLNFSNITSAQRIVHSIVNYSPDVIGYSCYSWNIEKVLDTIEIIREKTQAIQVMGGPEISVEMIYSLKNPQYAHYYVIGEGEESFSRLVNYLYNRDNNISDGELKGIAVWDDVKKQLHYQKDFELVELDRLPSVYLKGIIDERLYKGGQVYIETQRGCKYKCRYCAYHKNVIGIRYFPLKRVFEEIDFLVIDKKVSALRFLDSIFTSDLNRAKLIVQHLQNLKSEGVKLPVIYWEYNYNTADAEFLQMVSALKNSRIESVFDSMEPIDKPQIYDELAENYTVINCIGMQTLNYEALKAIGRAGIDTAELNNFMELSKKNNILLKVDMILGLPFETLESYLMGLESLLGYFEFTDHILNIHILQLLPGTDLYKNSSKYGIEYSENAPHYVSATNTMDTVNLSYASKLSAVLFRVVNSPLRKLFYKVRNRLLCSNISLVQKIYDEILSFESFNGIKLVKDTIIDDEYWNHKIFADIPSNWIKDALCKLQQDKAPLNEN
jgi:radical SAM superfamily enzyme YgiQ (UPF0313 family)